MVVNTDKCLRAEYRLGGVRDLKQGRLVGFQALEHNVTFLGLAFCAEVGRLTRHGWQLNVTYPAWAGLGEQGWLTL